MPRLISVVIEDLREDGIRLGLRAALVTRLFVRPGASHGYPRNASSAPLPERTARHRPHSPADSPGRTEPSGIEMEWAPVVPGQLRQKVQEVGVGHLNGLKIQPQMIGQGIGRLTFAGGADDVCVEDGQVIVGALGQCESWR